MQAEIFKALTPPICLLFESYHSLDKDCVKKIGRRWRSCPRVIKRRRAIAVAGSLTPSPRGPIHFVVVHDRVAD
jgi:hypothetical protein